MAVGSCRRRILSRRSSGGGPSGYSNSYYVEQPTSLPPRARSEYGGTTRRSRSHHYSSSPERGYGGTMSDYGGTRRPPHDSRYSTMKSDATGDWQYFGPDEVPTQKQTMSLRRRSTREPIRSSHSDYYGPTSNSRHVYRSSQSDYNVPITRRPRPSTGGPRSDYGGSTQSLKIVRKSSAPRNGYASSSDESFQDAHLIRSTSTPRTKNKNSLVKKTVRRTISRRDASPNRNDPQRIVVQELNTPERISVYMQDEPDYSQGRRDRTMSLGRDTRSHSLGRDQRTPGKIHTIQTLTREKTETNRESLPSTHKTTERTVTSQQNPQPLQVATVMKKEIITNQQSAAPQQPITSGHTTLTFSGSVKPTREEKYVNKVFQQNDQPPPKKPVESFKSGVIQKEDYIPQPIPRYTAPPQPAPRQDLHKTRINFLTSEPPKETVNHHSKIDLKVPVTPPPKDETDYGKAPKDEPDHGRAPKPKKPKKSKKKKKTDLSEELDEDITLRSWLTHSGGKYFEEVLVKKPPPAPVSDPSDEETTNKTTKTTKIVRYIEEPQRPPTPKKRESNQEVEEITETTIKEIYSDMTPERQKTFSELTKTALGRTEQTTGNFFNGGDSKSLITEAWHTNRPKTEQEIIDEITSKTTSEVVKRSILDGVDYKFVPTHSKELEEIQRKRKEFEAEMLRQRKIRDIKAGIRQNIHVDHNEEDLVGDYSMSVTDDGQIDMDTIEEHVDLGINENGIAAIAVKVTAERILPVDVDNNLWRKSSVTVTRTIEIDLMRCEETRKLYEKILKAHKVALNVRAEEAARHGLPPQQHRAHELDATDTYKIFSALMNVTGEGDNEDLGILSGEAAKHFLSGNYIRDPEEKQRAFGKHKTSSSSGANNRSSNRGQTTTKTTSKSVTTGNSDNMFDDLTLGSLDPERIRSQRGSEYYRQKMRTPSPPPEFGSSMFNGDNLANKFDESLIEREETSQHNRTYRSRSPSPVRDMTSNQRKFYEQQRKDMNITSRSRLHDPRHDVIRGQRDLSPPQYTDRVTREHSEYHRNGRSPSPPPRHHHSSGADSSFENKTHGEEVMFSERVSGVKQRANDMRRNNEFGSHDDLSNSDRRRYEETAHVDRSEGRQLNSLNGYNENSSRVRSGGPTRSSYERKETITEARDDNNHKHRDVNGNRARMFGYDQDRNQARDQYESGYYSDMPTSSRSDKNPTTDINRMLQDAERYFKKSASERELSRSEEEHKTTHYVQKSTYHNEDADEFDRPLHDQENRMKGSSNIMRTSHRDDLDYDDPRDSGKYNQRSTVRHVQYRDENPNYRSHGSLGRLGQGQSSWRGSTEDMVGDDDGYVRVERSHKQYSSSPSVRRSERHVEQGDNYIQAPAEELFDTRDSYFDDKGGRHVTHSTVRQQRESSYEHPDTHYNSETEYSYRDIPHDDSRLSADDYLNVRTRRSELQQEMNEKGIDGEQILADRRRAMLGGGSRYVPNSSSRRVVTSRRTSGIRR